MSDKKGSASSVLLVIIVIVAVAAIFFISSGGRLPFSLGSAGISYDNTVITVTDKLISDLRPISNSETNLLFFVTNKGDKTVDSVDMRIVDKVGFDIKSLQCHEDELSGRVAVAGSSCEIRKIASGDSREVRIVMETNVDLEPTDEPAPALVKYKISFPYSGKRFAQIPVVGAERELPAGVRFLIDSPTVGPVQVDVEPPVGAKREVDGRLVDENFGREGLTFAVNLKFSDVGAPSGSREPVVFKDDSVQVKLENVEVETCDGKKPGAQGDTIKLDVKDQKLPFEIKCTMRPTGSDIQSHIFATLDVQFDYTYSFTVSESNFQIIPPVRTT